MVKKDITSIVFEGISDWDLGHIRILGILGKGVEPSPGGCRGEAANYTAKRAISPGFAPNSAQSIINQSIVNQSIVNRCIIHE